MPLDTRPSKDIEQALRDAIGKPDRVQMKYPEQTVGSTFGTNLPQVPHAPPFRQEPLVIGRSSTANLVDNILKIAPELRGHTNKIQVGPNEAVINRLLRSDMSPYDYGISTLLGTTGMGKYQPISINPSLENSGSNEQLVNTLIHELAHTRGYGEKDAYRIENLMPPDLVTNPDDAGYAHYKAGLYRNSPTWSR